MSLEDFSLDRLFNINLILPKMQHGWPDRLGLAVLTAIDFPFEWATPSFNSEQSYSLKSSLEDFPWCGWGKAGNKTLFSPPLT